MWMETVNHRHADSPVGIGRRHKAQLDNIHNIDAKMSIDW